VGWPIRLAVLVLVAAAALAQDNDRAYELLDNAFGALRAHDYDAAIASFEKAAAVSPDRADIRKNLAYALLKTGENDAARLQFGEAMRIDPDDFHVALEYAFLCHEARDNAPARKAEARRIFARIKDSGDAESRATASRAFAGIDAPLAGGIARWQQVIATSPPTFSALYELAQLAEQRDQLELASSSYKSAFALLPARKSVLLELARVDNGRGDSAGMMAALLAASRGGETRTAELAREQLPDRYPYVYEFREALKLDPKNEELHRELAYLLLSMSEKDESKKPEAVQEFKRIAEESPTDYLASAQLGLLYQAQNQNALAQSLFREVLAHGDAATANRVRMALKMPLVLEEHRSGNAALDPLTLGQRSYDAGFLKDAKRYFLIAREQNPIDASIPLKLGWTENMLHNDVAAMRWFDIARESSDANIASEAGKAYANLRPDNERFRSTFWMYPLLSSRWSDLFGYAQFKTDLKLNKRAFRPYASIRLAGDARRETGAPIPQSLSESSFILGIGVATRQWRGATGWFEAGTSISYLDASRLADYRGGVSYSRTIGISLTSERTGWFLESTADSVFISRFSNDLLNYSQNRTGFTSSVAGYKIQTFWANNITFDVKKQYWTNFAETGPGFRFHPPAAPKSAYVTLGAVRGIYLRNHGNPRRPNYYDLRAGVWYAFTK